jgi:hypothetical protein
MDQLMEAVGRIVGLIVEGGGSLDAPPLPQLRTVTGIRDKGQA